MAERLSSLSGMKKMACMRTMAHSRIRRRAKRYDSTISQQALSRLSRFWTPRPACRRAGAKAMFARRQSRSIVAHQPIRPRGVFMSDLSAFPIAKRWPAQYPDRLQLYSLPTPNGVKVSIALEEHSIDASRTVLRCRRDTRAICVTLPWHRR